MNKQLEIQLSVIMPVYNAAPYLREAIQSILDQTYSNFEFIIINDASTDSSLEVMCSFNDPRIKVVNNETNLGIIKTRNKGFQLSQGKYIAKMDADDISLPTRFEKQIKFLESHQNVAALATKLILVDEKGSPKGYWHEDMITTSDAEINAMLPIINCVGQPTMMLRSDIVKPIGYNINYPKNEDWGLWLDIIARGHGISKLDEVLVKYRVHSTGTTVTANSGGVHKKIIKFKLAYCKENFKHFRFKKVELSVFKSVIKDILKLVFRPTYHFLKKVKQVHLLRTLAQAVKVKGQLNAIKNKPKNIFFFPYFHVGGAERVHLSIVEAVSDKNNIVFFTGVSSGDALLSEFKKHATVIEINYIVGFSKAKRWFVELLQEQKFISDSTVLFGCNSYFYYELLASIPDSVKCVDLTHAFVHKFEDGAEKWSLPVVSKLDNRVVISKNTIGDFEKLYSKNNIAISYVERIKLIRNFVEEQERIENRGISPLKILYVGRGSLEKRVHLIARAAKNANKLDLPVAFHFIGDVKNAIPAEELKYCTLHGEITDINLLNQQYEGATALIIASSREGFPMVIMEAMMHGVIPISTNVGGISEHISNNVNGFLINTISEDEIVAELVETIKYLCNSNDKVKEISKAAYNYAKENFSKNKFVNEYRDLLNS